MKPLYPLWRKFFLFLPVAPITADTFLPHIVIGVFTWYKTPLFVAKVANHRSMIYLMPHIDLTLRAGEQTLSLGWQRLAILLTQ